MEWLEIIGPVTALMGILGMIFNFSVIRPLNEAIRNLSNTIDNMRAQLHEIDEKRQDMAVRLATVESSVKSAHHRIDGIEERAHHD